MSNWSTCEVPMERRTLRDRVEAIAPMESA